MKKLIILLFLALLLTFSACSAWTPVPYGVWQSEYPNITLIVDREYATVLYRNRVDEGSDGNEIRRIIHNEDVFHGTYEKDGEIVDIVIDFFVPNGMFGIQNASIDTPVMSQDTYFSGSYGLRGNRLYLHLSPGTQERTGFRRIVFELVEAREADE